jgi:hypothetical protein
MSIALSYKRITTAVEKLNDSIITLDTAANVTRYRADLLFKVALANYFIGNKANALSFLAEANKANQSGKTDMFFQKILDYWGKILVAEGGFAVVLEGIDDFNLITLEVMIWYSAIPYHELPQEYREAVACVTEGKLLLCSFRHDTDWYNSEEIPVYRDNEKELYFAEIEGRRLYYYDGDVDEIMGKILFVNKLEQGEHSPHLYFTDEFQVGDGDVFVDIGAGEANSTLTVIDKCDHAYIFEGLAIWEKPLQATFAPYQEKVTIVKEMVSDVTEDGFTTLDDCLAGQRISFIKLDVEGYEMKALRGAERLLRENQEMKICVCTYHYGGDAREIWDFLEERGFTCEYSEGFMVFILADDFREGSDPAYPYFRRGLIRARRGA